MHCRQKHEYIQFWVIFHDFGSFSSDMCYLCVIVDAKGEYLSRNNIKLSQGDYKHRVNNRKA